MPGPVDHIPLSSGRRLVSWCGGQDAPKEPSGGVRAVAMPSQLGRAGRPGRRAPPGWPDQRSEKEEVARLPPGVRVLRTKSGKKS